MGFAFCLALVIAIASNILFSLLQVHTGPPEVQQTPVWVKIIIACGLGPVAFAALSLMQGTRHIGVSVMKGVEAATEGPLPFTTNVYSILIAGYVDGYEQLPVSAIAIRYGSIIFTLCTFGKAFVDIKK